ncbi:MAG: proline dehydrogenase family protein, partial [Bacteroidia bacterium]
MPTDINTDLEPKIYISGEGLSFNNLQVAFSAKTDSELRNDYYLFKLIGKRWLVNAAPLFVNLALRLRLPIKGIIRATAFKHFCGGESISDCAQTVKQLYKYKIGSILDYSVEGEEKEENFNKTADEIIATINRAKGDPAIPFCVFKPTGLARFSMLQKMSNTDNLDSDEFEESTRIYDRINKICKAAAENNVRIFIDAEESWIQKAIDDIACRMMMQYNKQKPVVYNTIQLYRTDRLEYLKKSVDHVVKNNYIYGIKLVRGAYMEMERTRAAKLGYTSPIQPDKISCDRDFDEALHFCINKLEYVAFCAGTHNEESSMLLVNLMKLNNIPHNHSFIYFSQLLGMSDHISYNLAAAGYNVVKYVPYGPVDSVLPYLIRRAQENTSMSGQMSRELGLIVAERARRKKLKQE